MSDLVRVLVLCTGNIGRSPLAAASLRHAVATELGVSVSDLPAAGVEISSAGVDAPEGHGASSRGQAFAARRGLDLSDHVARQLTAEMIARSDIIYAMDYSHVDAVGRLDPDAASRVRLWEDEGSEIPDPHHLSDEFFLAVAGRIEAATPARASEVMTVRRREVG